MASSEWVWLGSNKRANAEFSKLNLYLTNDLCENFEVGFVGAFFCSFFGQAKKERDKKRKHIS